MAAVEGILRLPLMLRSLIASLVCNPSRERRRGIRNSRRDKVRVMVDTRSQFAPRLGMGRLVRSRGRSIRCGLRRRLGICRSGWRSTTICRWISRSACFGRSRALIG